MSGAPLLTLILKALHEVRLEAILIGNAAAAIHGAPVTTVDFDFMFRATPGNMTKLKRFARQLDAVVFRQFYPVSSLFRVMNDDHGLQVDFIPVRSFNSVSISAGHLQLGRHSLLPPDLTDIIPRKRPSCPPTKRFAKNAGKKRKAALSALRKESDRALIDLIRRRLALPIEKRMNFLRVRIPGGGSHL